MKKTLVANLVITLIFSVQVTTNIRAATQTTDGIITTLTEQSSVISILEKVTAAIIANPENAPEIVQVAVFANPELASEIVTAAVEAGADQNEMIEAALLGGANEDDIAFKKTVNGFVPIVAVDVVPVDVGLGGGTGGGGDTASPN